MTKRTRFFFAAIFLTGLGLRCLAIGSRSIQYDDAFTFFLAGRSLTEIVPGTLADTMPPLFYFLLHFWMKLGTSLVWLRLLSVVLSLSALVLLFLTVCELADEEAGLWAMFFAAISPFQIYHAQDIRMYAFLGALQLGVTWLFVRLWVRRNQPGKRRGEWVALVLCAAAALYTHNLAVFGLAAPFVFLLLRREMKLLFRYGMAMFAAAILALPWWLVLPAQLQKIQTAFWTPRPGLVEVIQAVIQTTTSLPLPAGRLYAAAFVALTLLIFIGLESWRSRRESGVQFLLLTALLPPLILFAVSYLMRPIFVPRGFIVANLAYYGLAGVLAAHKFPKGVGVILAAGFVAAALVSLSYQISFRQFPRSPYQEAAALLETSLEPGEIVLHDNKLSYLPMRYYDSAMPQLFLPDEPGSHNDTFAPASQQAMQIFPTQDWPAALKGRAGFFFVVFSKTIAEYQAMGMSHPMLGALNRDWQMDERTVLNDLEIYHYIP